MDTTRLYIGDYFTDTLDFTSEQHVVFQKLLLHLWLDGPLTLKDRTLRKQSELSRADWFHVRELFWPALQTALSGVLQWKLAIKAYDGQRLPAHDWQLLRLIVLTRDNYTCAYCDSTDDLHVDHRIAISRGGSNSPENLDTACGPCNQSKGPKGVQDWLAGGRSQNKLKNTRSTVRRLLLR